jgi:PadR family transcriptional regulator
VPRAPHASPQTLRLFEALLADPVQWRYGYDLSRETGLASGTLYPILMRLSEQRLLETGWEPSDEPGRPPRHTYRLTADGLALARQRTAAAAERAPGTRHVAGERTPRTRPAGRPRPIAREA